MVASLVVLFLLLAVVGYLIGTYNSLVQVRAAVKLAWSNIDVLLVQRHDELPKLVEVCKQYMQYEPGTLERVMRARAGVDAARTSGDVAALGPAEHELRTGLTGLYAVAENYPELKASQNFRDLQAQLEGTENRITVERMRFNDAAKEFNTRRSQVPAVLFANFFGFKEKPYFQAAPGAENAPKVKF